MKPEKNHLVAACQRNDADALRQLYEEFSPMMLGVCMRYTRSRDEAQDLLHDGFLKVYKNIGKLKHPIALEDWIYRIMVNVCVNYVCRHREVVYCGLSGMDNGQNEDQFTETPFDTDPFETAEVMKAIRALPDPYQAVFNMKEVDGFDYPEIAERMDMKEVTVRSIVSRAKKMLRDALEPIV